MMTIDHICFAVENIEISIKDWINAFDYRQMTEIITNTRQKVRVVFLEKSKSLTIKLIEPLIENRSLHNFLKQGGGFHHICFKCNNLENTIDALKVKGLISLVSPQPGEAFDNEDIAFMLTKFGVNIELIETDKKAGLIPNEHENP
jgi:methylmalonyl-CoA/ethylmalonyl-CoA epimerase